MSLFMQTRRTTLTVGEMFLCMKNRDNREICIEMSSSVQSTRLIVMV